MHSPYKHLQNDNPVPGQIMELMKSCFFDMTKKQRSNLLFTLFDMYLREDIDIPVSVLGLRSFVPHNFLELCGEGMRNLATSGKENTLLHFAKCLTKRTVDGTDTRMPIDKMPFGMIAYNCKFFASNRSGHIKIPDDYMSWMATMYAHFGSQWASLHLGPNWCHSEGIEGEKLFIVDSTCSIENNDDIVAAALSMGDISLDSFADNLSTTNVLTPLPLDSAPPSSSSTTDTSITVPTLPTCTPTTTGNSSNDTPSPQTSSTNDTMSLKKRVSTLWSNLSSAEKAELEISETSQREIEEIFHVRPRNDGIGSGIQKDPLTVSTT
jgi:hypothetical protein